MSEPQHDATDRSGRPGPLFDDPPLFRLIEQRLLPALVAARRSSRRLRLWSAACGNGSEPYTLALLSSALLAHEPGWQLSVLGSEPDRRWPARPALLDPPIPPPLSQSLRQAGLQRGIGSAWTVAAAVRRLVELMPIDLSRDRVPSLLNGSVAIDLIVCRGLQSALPADQSAQAVARLARALAPGGYLLIDAEMPRPPADGLRQERVGAHRLWQRIEPATDGDRAVIADQAGAPASAGTDPEAIHSRALIDYRQGRLDAARDALQAAVRWIPQPARSLALLARIEAAQGRLDAARGWSELALAIDELEPGHHCLRGGLLQEHGAYGEAMQAYQRALYLDPGFMLAHFGLGRLARRLGRLGEAERHYGNAAALARAMPPDAPLPHADGVTAGRLAAIVALLQDDHRDATVG